MNIWLLTGEYPPDYGGGISTYCHHTVQMLGQRGHHLTVITPTVSNPGSWQEEIISSQEKVVRFGPNQSPQSGALGSYARDSYDSALVLSDLVRKEGLPDVLEAQEYLGLPYYVLQRRWLLDDTLKKLPVLLTAHTPLYLCHRYDQVPTYRFPGYWVGEMERFSLLAADTLVYPSACLRNEIEKDLPQVKDHGRVIANPYLVSLPDTHMAGSQARHGFLYTAKIERRKGLEPLLLAFSQLWDAGLNEPLYLVGDDWYDELNQRMMSVFLKEKYRRFIKADLLRWEGKQPSRVVMQKLNTVKALILPSLFENYPYAVLEAMAVGCPVIVSKSGGHAEMVRHGVSGYVFSHQKSGDLVEKIQALLKLTPTQYERMSSAAQARVAQISGYDVVAPQKEEALARVHDLKQNRRSFPFLRGSRRTYKKPAQPAMAGKTGRLSIVIPFYNLGDYLEDTLKSLSGLSGVPVEIIVMDDGSTEVKSLDRLSALQLRYKFRLERSGNQGLVATRNTGAALAKGEFLAFIDADDMMDPIFYRRAIDILNQYQNVSYVGCWAEYFGDTTGYWPTWTPEPPYALVHNPINSSALIYRRADFLRYGLNDPAFCHLMEDYDSLINLLGNGCRGVALPEPYFKYRVRGLSMFHKTTDNIKLQAYEMLVDKHKLLFNQYAQEVIGLINTNGPAYLFDNPSQWYPAVGFPTPSGSTAAGVSSSSNLPSSPARKFLLQISRAVLQKPYRSLRERYPAVERLKTKIKQRIEK